jgi:hypothetical protein
MLSLAESREVVRGDGESVAMKWPRLIAFQAVLLSLASGCAGPNPIVQSIDYLHYLVMPCHYGPYPGNGQGMVGGPGGRGCANCGPGQTDDWQAGMGGEPDDGAERPQPQTGRNYPAYSTARN